MVGGGVFSTAGPLASGGGVLAISGGVLAIVGVGMFAADSAKADFHLLPGGRGGGVRSFGLKWIVGWGSGGGVF